MAVAYLTLLHRIATRRVGFIALVSMSLLAACGGENSNNYVVSAEVSGLQAGKSLVLLNNGANRTVVSANGTIAFGKTISSGSPFAVTVATQPTGETCGAAPGTHLSGFSNINVTVAVACTANAYSIGGMVGGLEDAGGGVVLQLNHGNTITINSNGAFTFASLSASGAPYTVTVLTPPNGETCTVTNGKGTVQGANVTSVSVYCQTLPVRLIAAVIGTSNTTGLVLQNNGGDNLSVSGPGVYVFKTLVSSGSAYDITVLTQPPGNTCLVIGGSGTVSATTVDVTVVCPWHVAYMSGAPNSNAVYGFYIDENLGTLIPFATGAFASGSSPSAIAISPDSRLAYVLTGDNTVWVYTIDATTGALSHIATNTVPAGAKQIAISPDGNVAYIAALPSELAVYGFSINRTTGEFSPVPGSPFATVGYDQSITLNPAGTFAYVATGVQTNVYTVDGTSGALVPIAGSPFSGVGISPLHIDPTGRFLYDYDSASVSVFAIDPSTGALSPITGSPFRGTGSDVACFEATGRFLYTFYLQPSAIISGPATEFVSTYGIDASTGAIKLLNVDDVQVYWSPALGPCVADPSGKYFFMAGAMGYGIYPPTGAITQLWPSWPDAAAGMNVMAIASIH
jgi:hypothetical protein